MNNLLPLHEAAPFHADQWMAGLPYDGAEFSCKITPGRIQTGRILYGIAKDKISLAWLHKLSQHLHMPASYWQTFIHNYDDANFVYLGSEDEQERRLWKWYLEFPVYRGLPEQGAPRLMYIGLKWQASDASPLAITHYHWRMHPSPAALQWAIQAICGPDGKGVGQCAAAILQQIPPAIATEQLLFLEVSEADTERRSFDLKLYPSGLQIGDCAVSLRTLAQHMRVPETATASLLERIKMQPFGHLAGGIDRSGQPFATIYYEA
jgi:hypothetical protein